MVCLTLSHPSRQYSLGPATRFSLLVSAMVTAVQCGCWMDSTPMSLPPLVALPAPAAPEFILEESPKSARSFWMLCGCARGSAGRLDCLKNKQKFKYWNVEYEKNMNKMTKDYKERQKEKDGEVDKCIERKRERRECTNIASVQWLQIIK